MQNSFLFYISGIWETKMKLQIIRLSSSCLCLFSSFSLYAAPDPAFVRDEVYKTVYGAPQRSTGFSDDDYRSIVSAAYKNSAQMRNMQQETAAVAKGHLQSSSSRQDQAWTRQTINNLESKKEYEDSQKVGMESCLNAQKYANINCPD